MASFYRAHRCMSVGCGDAFFSAFDLEQHQDDRLHHQCNKCLTRYALRYYLDEHTAQCTVIPRAGAMMGRGGGIGNAHLSLGGLSSLRAQDDLYMNRGGGRDDDSMDGEHDDDDSMSQLIRRMPITNLQRVSRTSGMSTREVLMAIMSAQRSMGLGSGSLFEGTGMGGSASSSGAGAGARRPVTSTGTGTGTGTGAAAQKASGTGAATHVKPSSPSASAGAGAGAGAGASAGAGAAASSGGAGGATGSVLDDLTDAAIRSLASGGGGAGGGASAAGGFTRPVNIHARPPGSTATRTVVPSQPITFRSGGVL